MVPIIFPVSRDRGVLEEDCSGQDLEVNDWSGLKTLQVYSFIRYSLCKGVCFIWFYRTKCDAALQLSQKLVLLCYIVWVNSMCCVLSIASLETY